jgi:RNA polymerase-binding transcription factor DksA
MTTLQYVPIAGAEGPAVDVQHDAATRLRALLVSSRHDGAERLKEVARTKDPASVDEHAEITATVAGATLRDIDYALSRFDAGTYGSCEVCSAAIPLERLEAIPHTTTCVGCALPRSTSA